MKAYEVRKMEDVSSNPLIIINLSQVEKVGFERELDPLGEFWLAFVSTLEGLSDIVSVFLLPALPFYFECCKIGKVTKKPEFCKLSRQ